MRIVTRAAARYHRMHMWQLGLAVLGVALGTAVVVAVDVAIASARRSFELATAAASGRATHEITGGPGGVSDSAYVRVRRILPAGVDAAPIIDRHVRLPDHRGRVLRLLGVDPFAERPFRDVLGPGSASTAELGTLLTRRAVLLSRATAASLGLVPGDTIRLAFGVHITPALLAGVLDPADDLARRTLADIALADISTAQELTAAIGTIDRIELRIAGSAPEQTADTIARALPPELRMAETQARIGATAGLMDAFETNLTALALIALVFGLFLIHNSVSFSVVQRRQLFGLLRAQGVTARELFVLIMAEAGAIGVLATLLGMAGGLALGTELVQLVVRTINDLYFAVAVTSIRPGATTLVKAGIVGVAGALASASGPALETVRVEPRSAMTRVMLERRTSRRAPRLLIAGLACAATAAALLLLPSRSIELGFAALFILILAAALITPAFCLGAMRAAGLVTAQLGAIGRLAPRGVAASLSRTAPAIAALAVALAVGIAVTLMIDSFRAGVVRWLDQSLQADIYIAAPGAAPGGPAAALPPGLARRVRELPGVAGVSTYRVHTLPDLVRIFAFDPYAQHRDAFELLDADAAAAWHAFERGAVLVSEPFAWRRGVAAGDSIVLPTDRGSVAFTIAGTYRDYASERGAIFIARPAYERYWDDREITSLAVFVREGVVDAALLARIRALPAAAGVTARLDRGLRDATLAVFDRTFLITGVLRLLALLVAFVGVTSALMALQLERAREIGVLRAIGLTPAQVWLLITAQTALMGIAAAALAAPLGIAMSAAMVHVINRRSFGWTFDLLFGGAPFAAAVATGIGAAVLAGIYPAARMARLRPAAVLRDE